MNSNHSFLLIFIIFTILVFKSHNFSSPKPKPKSKPTRCHHFKTAGRPDHYVYLLITTTKPDLPEDGAGFDFLLLAFLSCASLCIIVAGVRFSSFLRRSTRGCFSAVLRQPPAAEPPTIQRRPPTEQITPSPRYPQPSTAAAFAPDPDGITPSVLHTLPIFMYSTSRPPRFGVGATEGCCICISDFVTGQLTRWLPDCGHFFHLRCIDRWFQSHKTCPFCRANVENDDHQEAAEHEIASSRTESSTPTHSAGSILSSNSWEVGILINRE